MILFCIDTPEFKYSIDSFQFSAGERQVRLPCTMMPAAICERLVVRADITCPADVMDLLLTVDALKRKYGSLSHIQKTLFLPYLPYSRQDRVCADGEALSIAVFAELVNMLGFDKVVTLDCHSEVGVALINNCHNIPQCKLVTSCLSSLYKHSLVIADAGAAKKVYSLAKKINSAGGNEIIKADKIRCPSTGEITGTVVHADVLDPKGIYLIVDDICDGGRTFTELANALKAKGATNILLWVTHGLFSKGVHIFDGVFAAVYRTDSFARTRPIGNVANMSTLFYTFPVVEDMMKREFS